MRKNFYKTEGVKFCAATKIERDFLQIVGGGCQIPVGIYAEVDGEKISARAIIASIDGKIFVKDSAVDNIKNLDNFGKNFAQKLLSNGGEKILQSNIRGDNVADKNSE